MCMILLVTVSISWTQMIRLCTRRTLKGSGSMLRLSWDACMVPAINCSRPICSNTCGEKCRSQIILAVSFTVSQRSTRCKDMCALFGNFQLHYSRFLLFIFYCCTQLYSVLKVQFYFYFIPFAFLLGFSAFFSNSGKVTVCNCTYTTAAIFDFMCKHFVVSLFIVASLFSHRFEWIECHYQLNHVCMYYKLFSVYKKINVLHV